MGSVETETINDWTITELGGTEGENTIKETGCVHNNCKCDGWTAVPSRRTLGDFITPPPGLRKRVQLGQRGWKATHENYWKELQSVEKEEDEVEETRPEIMAVGTTRDQLNTTDGHGSNYEKVTITVDSGAVDTVGPKKIAEELPIKPTKASRMGVNYRAANGTTIKNYGEKRLEGWNEKGRKTGLTMQVADVSKILGSVSKMTKAKNTIIFSAGKSIITSDPEGRVAEAAIKASRPENTTELRESNGVYTFDLWIPRKNGETINEVQDEKDSS